MGDKLIAIESDFLEHLLACLANQKYINEFNADAVQELSVDEFELHRQKTQRTIDKAWNKGMKILNEAVTLIEE